MQLVDGIQILVLLFWGGWSLKKITAEGWWHLPIKERAAVPFSICLSLFLASFPFQIGISYLYLHLAYATEVIAPLTILLSAVLFTIITLLPPLFPIWKRQWGDHFWKSVKIGAIALFVVAPLVFLTEGTLILIFEHLLGFPKIEQTAILYLLSLKDSPFLFTVVAILIGTFVPLFEEIVFRGCLQNALRAYLPPKIAISLTAIIFTLFHFSYDQGISNLIILPSLLVLAFALSYIYEKTGNLVAPITFHCLFNTVSVLTLAFQ